LLCEVHWGCWQAAGGALLGAVLSLLDLTHTHTHTIDISHECFASTVLPTNVLPYEPGLAPERAGRRGRQGLTQLGGIVLCNLHKVNGKIVAVQQLKG